MRNLAVLLFRLVLGGLLAGHGAQKLFGWFNGPGIEGTSGFMEMLGLKPGRPWAYLAGAPSSGAACSRPSGCCTP
jgi:putative oxidoreductase